MSEYTPTEARICIDFCNAATKRAQADGSFMSMEEADAAFSRWLAAHDAEVRAAAIGAAGEHVPAPALIDRVFLVTSGEYSDYSISSAWTTREAAEKEAGTWGEVEEWLVNTTEERTVAQWHARIIPETGEIRVEVRAEVTNSPSATHVQRLSIFRRTVGGSEWEGHGYGPSPEHARKSLADALAKAKAEDIEEQGEKR